jgi:hypothetical protein
LDTKEDIMDDLKLVEEFLSKKNLDGVDKFLLDKYMGAIESLLKHTKQLEEDNCKWRANYVLLSAENGVIPKKVIRDKIEELEKTKKNYNDSLRFYTLKDSVTLQENVLKELLEEE